MRNKDRTNYYYDIVLGSMLKDIRIKKGYSLQDIAKKLKTTKQAIFRYENADIIMKKSTFLKYCRALDEEPLELYKKSSVKYMEYIVENKDKLLNS